MFEWEADSGAGYKLLAHASFSPPDKAYGNIQVEQRGYGTGSFSRGKGVVIPLIVGAGYRKIGLPVYRDFSSRF
jgi:hypothetical protein